MLYFGVGGTRRQNELDGTTARPWLLPLVSLQSVVAVSDPLYSFPSLTYSSSPTQLVFFLFLTLASCVKVHYTLSGVEWWVRPFKNNIDVAELKRWRGQLSPPLQ